MDHNTLVSELDCILMSSSSVDDIHCLVVNAVLLDSGTITDYIHAPLNTLLQAEYHDTSTIILLISPELNLLIEEYVLAYVDNSGMRGYSLRH